MSDDMQEDKDDFTDASATFSHRFKLSSSERIAGKKDSSVQHLGEILSYVDDRLQVVTFQACSTQTRW